MDRTHMLKTGRSIAASALLALAATQVAAEPGVVWVDNEHFGFTSCRALDALPGNQDPKDLMRALRERGLADANRMVRARGVEGGKVFALQLSTVPIARTRDQADTADPAPPVRWCRPLEGEAAARPLRGWA